MKHFVAANTRYGVENQFSLATRSPVVLFSEAKFTTSIKKHLEEIEILFRISVMHKLLSFPPGKTDLVYGFDGDINRRKHDLTNNAARQNKVYFSAECIHLIEFFGFADQEN